MAVAGTLAAEENHRGQWPFPLLSPICVFRLPSIRAL